MKTKRPATTITAVVFLCIAGFACRPSVESSAGEATAGIDSLNARLVHAYRSHDPQAYAALYTDTAVFEWPAFNTVRGPAQLAAMARSNWASLKDMDLRLTVSARRVAPGHATEVEVGRGACRGRGENSVGGGSFKKKKED